MVRCKAGNILKMFHVSPSPIIVGNCLDVLPTLEAGSVQCCVTSPPYWGLRDYGMVAESLGRKWLLIELNPEYEKLSRERTAQTGMAFA